ncbi:MAG TPA: EpsD family peptidyl-prolyl cis-trans isomerase [Methylotenera sp.]|nr:EpsD family peptidyl-prolyl cis-trans isomerase [Methylotenera sp.]
MRFTNKYLLLLLISSAIVSTACGKKEESEAKKSETQVVAKVNDDEISIHQVNYQLGRMGQLNETQSKAAAKQILARLVDQQLLKQQALEAKLDRDPRILQVLESSKNEILAQAYLEQLMAKASKPSTTEIETFYNEHPELFENRRVFRLQELVVDVKQDKYAEVESNLKSIKGINEIATWLKDNNYPFTANSNVRAAEQLPLDLLKKMQTLKVGDVFLVPADRSLNIVHLAAFQSAPITRDKATSIIEQYFLNQNKATLAKKEMAALNSKAKVEFVGAFADMKKAEVTAPITPTTEAAKPSVQAVDAKPTATTSSKVKADDANMNKGLSGL